MRYLAVAALFALGCDDPGVAEKVTSVLQYGAVQAKMVCPDLGGHITGDPQCGPGNGFHLTWQVLADGSAFVQSPTGLHWYGRSESAAQTRSFYEPNYQDTWSIADGQVVIEKDGCSDIVYDIETECTGFNLEAFGVD